MAGDIAPRPHGVKHRRRRCRRIVVLECAQLVDVGEARSTRLEHRVAGSVSADIAKPRFGNIARELNGARPQCGFPIVDVVPAALVVVGAICTQRALSWHRARLIRINRRFLCHVVVAVGLCGGERRRNVAVFPTVPLVRVKRHAVVSRVRLDIGGKRRIGVGQRTLHVFLHARLEEHADGERHVDMARASRFVNLEVTQRDKCCRNLHFNQIARREIIRLGHRDDDRAQIARRIKYVARFA